MDLSDRLADLEDADIDALPVPLRWPVQAVLGAFLSGLVHFLVLGMGTAVGMGIHGAVLCSGCGSPVLPFRPTGLLVQGIGQHGPAFAAEAGFCLGLLGLANLALQGGIRHNPISRVTTALPGLLLGLAWTGWFAMALIAVALG